MATTTRPTTPSCVPLRCGGRSFACRRSTRPLPCSWSGPPRAHGTWSGPFWHRSETVPSSETSGTGRKAGEGRETATPMPTIRWGIDRWPCTRTVSISTSGGCGWEASTRSGSGPRCPRRGNPSLASVTTRSGISGRSVLVRCGFLGVWSGAERSEADCRSVTRSRATEQNTSTFKRFDPVAAAAAAAAVTRSNPEQQGFQTKSKIW
mmetsp:Transcript_23331/g.49687  ORF Transcript_23331/g.49687 Transcript_23331/m.49687 type:complete len:207 (+) Transcript_23331:82-702(+)